MVLGFLCDSAGKESACNVGNLGLIPGLGRRHGEGKGYPLPFSDLENSMDYAVHGVAKSRTQLSDFHFTSLLYMVLQNALISFFYMWLSSFFSITHCKDCLFSIMYSCLLCHRVIDHSVWVSFWDFCPVPLILPGSSVHGILQARILEWIAISFSRGSS